jgi:hypothetical protein
MGYCLGEGGVKIIFASCETERLNNQFFIFHFVSQSLDFFLITRFCNQEEVRESSLT